MEKMYASELVAKKVVLDSVPHERRRDVLTMYASSWVMQPLLDTVRVQEICALFEAEEKCVPT